MDEEDNPAFMDHCCAGPGVDGNGCDNMIPFDQMHCGCL